jgi:hypothetical protein
MLRRLKLGTKSEIENMCVAFWCLTSLGPSKGSLHTLMAHTNSVTCDAICKKSKKKIAILDEKVQAITGKQLKAPRKCKNDGGGSEKAAKKRK